MMIMRMNKLKGGNHTHGTLIPTLFIIRIEYEEREPLLSQGLLRAVRIRNAAFPRNFIMFWKKGNTAISEETACLLIHKSTHTTQHQNSFELQAD